MGAFGRFLEVSLPAGDVLRSLNFYRALGFHELTTGDVRRWHYAVVTDGSIAIGLHGAGLDEPALSFVRPNLARQVRALEQTGQAFEFTRLGAEEFNEAALRTPDGQMILMMEARTFSPGAPGSAPEVVIGHCSEVSLACADVAVTREFFEAAGFLSAAEHDASPARLAAPGLTLGLHATGPQAAPVLRFAAPRQAPQQLEELGLRVVRGPLGPVLTAPEGTRLLLAP